MKKLAQMKEEINKYHKRWSKIPKCARLKDM